MVADRPTAAGGRRGRCPAGRNPCYSRGVPNWIGPWELAILLVIVLLIFGPRRLPEMGRSLGRGLREFKNSVTGKDEEDRRELAEPQPADDVTPPTRERDTVH